MKKYLKISILIVFALTITLIFMLKPPSEPPIDAETDTLPKKLKNNAHTNEPRLGTPIVDQEIKQSKNNIELGQLKEGYARVKVKFTEEYKNKSIEEFAFKIVIYKDHQAIYTAEKKENEFLDMQFKMNEVYHFYLFKEKKMSYNEIKIQEVETILESTPKENIKKIIVKNDFKNLCPEFKLGCFDFNEKYYFRWLTQDELNLNEYKVFPEIEFPPDYHSCQLTIANTNGYFTISKTFEEIYNDKQIEVDLPNLKEISIKILNNNKNSEINLSFIPEKLILKPETAIQKISMNLNNSTLAFFTDSPICRIDLTVNEILSSKQLSLKEATTYVVFNLSEDILKPRKIIIENNSYGENLKLFRYIDNEKQGGFHGYMGRKYGNTDQLKNLAPNEFEYFKKNSAYQETLFFDIAENTTDINNENNQDKAMEPKRFGFLGVDFFKGNSEDEIHIDLSKQKFYDITLNGADSGIAPMFLVSLNEKFVLELRRDDNEKPEYKLLLKKGMYQIFSSDDGFYFCQSMEVNRDATIPLTNEFKKIISPELNYSPNEDEKKEEYYISYKNALPTRINLFQLLKNLNCIIKMEPGQKYQKTDLSYILFPDDESTEDETVNFRLLTEDYSYSKNKNKKTEFKFVQTNLSSHLLNDSEVLFTRYFAPNPSELQFYYSMHNIYSETILQQKRRDDENYPRHIFLSNFEYLILPPLNKPNEKIQSKSYGKIVFHFPNPLHHLFVFEILGENNQIKNTGLCDFRLFDNHTIYLDNITSGNSFEFNFLEFGTHQLEISNLTTGITYKYPFQVSEKYQEIEVK